MRILYFYLTKQFFKPLFFATFAFGFIVLISEFFREMNFYMERKTPFYIIGEYLLCNLPWWCIDVFAVSVLLALLFSLGELAKRNEFTVMKATGINLWKIIAFFMFLGFIIGVADFSVREFVIPKTVAKAEYIKAIKIRKKQVVNNIKNEHFNVIVALPNNARMFIGYLNIKDNFMKDVIIDEYSDDFYIKKNVIVGSAYFDGYGWFLQNGIEREYTEDTNNWNENYFEKKFLNLAIKPENFIATDKRYEQMNLKDFKEYIHKNQMLGQNTLKDQIKYDSRFANVFCHLIVMMIGIPFALGLGNKFGKILSFTFALIFSFIYWSVQAIALSLGENRVLSVWLAAWLPNIIFGIIGIYLLTKIKK